MFSRAVTVSSVFQGQYLKANRQYSACGGTARTTIMCLEGKLGFIE